MRDAYNICSVGDSRPDFSSLIIYICTTAILLLTRLGEVSRCSQITEFFFPDMHYLTIRSLL